MEINSWISLYAKLIATYDNDNYTWAHVGVRLIKTCHWHLGKLTPSRINTKRTTGNVPAESDWLILCCAKYANRMWNVCETYAKRLRNICETFAKRMQNVCETFIVWHHNACIWNDPTEFTRDADMSILFARCTLSLSAKLLITIYPMCKFPRVKRWNVHLPNAATQTDNTGHPRTGLTAVIGSTVTPSSAKRGLYDRAGTMGEGLFKSGSPTFLNHWVHHSEYIETYLNADTGTVRS